MPEPRAVPTDRGDAEAFSCPVWAVAPIYNTRGKGGLAREAGEQLVVLAQRQDDAALLLLARKR